MASRYQLSYEANPWVQTFEIEDLSIFPELFVKKRLTVNFEKNVENVCPYKQEMSIINILCPEK